MFVNVNISILGNKNKSYKWTSLFAMRYMNMYLFCKNYNVFNEIIPVYMAKNIKQSYNQK